MTGPIEIVRPGDLITYISFNHIASHLNDLMQRVATLEAQIQPGANVTLLPFSGSARIGDEITVRGTNFAVPVHLNVVMLDTVRITQFNPGTDDSHLVFNVPPGITGVPKDATFSVSNSTGSASMVIPVLPAGTPVPVGELRITQGTAETGPIQVGGAYNFPFILDSQTDITETYLVTARFDNASGAAAGAWLNNTRILNQLGSPQPMPTVTPGSPVTVRVAVTVPSGAVSVDLALRVQSISSPQDPKLNVTSTPVTLAVGEAPEISDLRTTFGSLAVAPSTMLQDGVIIAPGGETALIRVSAEFSLAGVYSYSTRMAGGQDTAWAVSIISPSTPTTTEAAGGSEDIVVQVLSPAAATDGSTLEIHAARVGPEGPAYDSWFSIPLRQS